MASASSLEVDTWDVRGELVADRQPSLALTTASLPAKATEMTIKQIVSRLGGVFPIDKALLNSTCCSRPDEYSGKES